MRKKELAPLLNLLQSTVTGLFTNYEHLKSRSDYWIFFDRKSRDTYGLSFWPKTSTTAQENRKVELPIIGSGDSVWFDCVDGVLDCLHVNRFESAPHPYATFNLTFRTSGPTDAIELYSVKPGSFADALKTLVPNHDPRTVPSRPCVGVP